MSLNLYAVSVPVFQRYLKQLSSMLDLAQSQIEAGAISEPDLLATRLAPDMLPLRSQVEVAGGFVLRALAPLLGRELPAFGEYPAGLAGLQELIRARQAWLAELTPEMFLGAEAKQIRGDAGHATITLPAVDFLAQFALPNFFFHLSCAYAILRQQGVTLSKEDFDGLHRWR
ncbi:DUF1993 domain-containing protein [Roseateles oligotrophus]|uniref:DUF1993 domain-containing protein n=1 Tax=Roseateles oligotrophus TaxID=1769250 RepID=A0ABT2YBX4_9BURK|nr:DUF1993 domain-containing protein [Roseateles oligotrophus]MCV2366905.1 DUF1993 domain-containing protein [Roseateles oligotrophus]